MRTKVVFATKNKGKMREIRQILGENYEVFSMEEAGIDIEIDENGSSFEENALIKANAVAAALREKGEKGQSDLSGSIVLADDSGFAIDCLNGEPGIYSARYLGEDTSYPEKCASFLERLKDVKGKDRAAHFICVIAAAFPDGRNSTAFGDLAGEVALSPKGTGGFGYDPIFFLPELGKTTAEITAEEKNALSHRGQALRAMKELLEKENA